MSQRLHQWIRELYLAAAESGGHSFNRLGLERATQLVPHAVSRWQVMDALGSLVSHTEFRVSAAAANTVDFATGDTSSAARTAACSINGGIGETHRFVFRRFETALAFDPDECRQLERAAEHLVCAAHIHRLTKTSDRPEPGAAHRDSSGLASIDSCGRILSADSHFTRLLHQAQPDWNGLTLPCALPSATAPDAAGSTFRGLQLSFQRQGDDWQLRIRLDQTAPKLSEREFQIAKRVAEGFTFREIGGDLGLAPSTISTHLYNLYAKLGIRRRAELIAWLRLHRNDS
jgi:DNA-binding CsgD family transcriptional regulator